MLSISKELIKHAREFAGYITKHQWERMGDGGILFPRARFAVHGRYIHGVNGADWQTDANLVPTEGLNSLLTQGVCGGTQITAWYLALYAGAISPTSSWTASNFASTATEITSGSEGYTQSTRVSYVPGTPASGAVDNSASLAAFTIATATSLTVNGAGLLSASAKGATSGKLMSASRFASARSLSNGDTFNLGYAVDGTST